MTFTLIRLRNSLYLRCVKILLGFMVVISFAFVPSELVVLLSLVFTSWKEEIRLWTDRLLLEDQVILFRNSDGYFERIKLRYSSFTSMYCVLYFGSRGTKLLVLPVDSFESRSDFKKLRNHIFWIMGNGCSTCRHQG